MADEALPMILQQVDLDIIPGKKPPVVHVSEYDTGRSIIVSLFKDGIAYGSTARNHSVTVKVEGTIGEYCFSEDASWADDSDKIVFHLTETMTAIRGRVWTKIKLTDSYGQQLSSCGFWLDVDRAGVEGDSIPSAPGFKEIVNQAVSQYLDEHGYELDEVITPEQYGAKGDGQTDDTLAIQKCIDENPSSTILFSCGVYNISQTIELWGASGGQMIILGGATLKWVGSASSGSMLRVSKDKSPVESSICRIVGGNIDGDGLVAIGIQNEAFYTDIGFTKIFNFTEYGIFNGPTSHAIDKSTQAKFHDLHIFMAKGNYSADPTCAIGISYPDNQISNVITNRTGCAFRLYSGGNSFSNCHTTIEYKNLSSMSASDFNGTHIELTPASSGTTQENIFTNMYFNAGKNVVHCKDRSTSLITHLSNCHYTFYSSADLPFRGEGYLYTGKAGVFICDSFDVVIGGNFDFYDYFPDNTPSENTVPRKLEINQNHRHPEASIFAANNHNTVMSKPSSIVNTNNPVPQAEKYYLIGAILETYTDSSQLADRFQGAVRIEWSSTDVHNEAVIAFDNLKPIIVAETCSAVLRDHKIFIGATGKNVTIAGKTYVYYPIYVYASSGLNYRMTLKAYSLDYYTKCYVRSHLTSDISPEETPGEVLQLGTKRGLSVDTLQLGSYYLDETRLESLLNIIPDYQRKPVTIWEVDGTTVTSGLKALQVDIAETMNWQLTGLNMSPYKRIKVYSKGSQGQTNAGTTGAMVLEMSLDPRMAIATKGGHYVGSVLSQKPNDANRYASLTCAVSADKTSFAVLRQTSLYGTAATTNNDIGADVVLIEGYYD